ncbi:MAG: hypothetical protein OER90_17235, partial [Gemmatimonadota bacterium]|nr:hypothetical protein [Gemmatimonadota bacterium]
MRYTRQIDSQMARFNNRHARRSSRWSSSLATTALLLGGLFVGAPSVYAQNMGSETLEDGCMEQVAQRGLNCTANDVSLATVTNLVIDDPCDFPGDLATFTATFETVLTAQARHDIGIFFDVAADPEGDGALTGTCQISTLNYTQDPPWLDLDGTTDNFAGTKTESGIQDTCGDIDSFHNPLFPVITVTDVECVDSDGDGFLNLPYCTSWRQPGSNELCTGPLPEDQGGGFSSSGVSPGSPSKCKCDPGFNVPVPVPPAELKVVKTASPEVVNEPGALVTFTVEVTNVGVDPNNDFTLNSLTDNIYGDITQVQGDIQSTTCSVPQTIAAGDAYKYTCSFTAMVSGNAGESETDTVTASGLDDNGNELSGEDDATVTIVGVDPSIVVIKGAVDGNDTVGSVDEPGGSIVFNVSVENTSVGSDPVTLTSLTDDVYGDITQVLGDVTATDCALATIQPGDTYTCSFTANVAGNGGENQVDTVTANGTDDEGVAASDSDQANVNIDDVAPTIVVIKGAVDGN